MDIVKSIESEKIIANLRADGIVHVHIKDRVIIDVDTQKEMAKIYNQLIDRPSPFIFTAGEFIKLTREAQKNARIMEAFVPISCSALVVNNIAQKLMADFYHKISPPSHPIIVLRNFDKAISWLSDQRKRA